MMRQGEFFGARLKVFGWRRRLVDAACRRNTLPRAISDHSRRTVEPPFSPARSGPTTRSPSVPQRTSTPTLPPFPTVPLSHRVALPTRPLHSEEEEEQHPRRPSPPKLSPTSLRRTLPLHRREEQREEKLHHLQEQHHQRRREEQLRRRLQRREREQVSPSRSRIQSLQLTLDLETAAATSKATTPAGTGAAAATGSSSSSSGSTTIADGDTIFGVDKQLAIGGAVVLVLAAIVGFVLAMRSKKGGKHHRAKSGEFVALSGVRSLILALADDETDESGTETGSSDDDRRK